jgi:hypothetical protein
LFYFHVPFTIRLSLLLPNKDLFPNIKIVFKTTVFNTSIIYTINVSFNVTLFIGSTDPIFTLIWSGLVHGFLWVFVH